MTAIAEILNEGLHFHQIGDLAKAEAAYHQVLQAEPEHPDALHRLGMLVCRKGDPARAAVLISKAIGREPTRPIFHCNLGIDYQTQGQLGLAIESLRRSLQLNPDTLEAHNNLGSVFGQQGNLREAAACFRHTLRLNANLVPAWVNLGNALLKLKQFDEAMLRAAMAQQDRGELETAEASYRRILGTAPNHVETHERLGGLYVKLDRYAEAEQCFRAAVRLQPEAVGSLHNLAIALSQSGQHAEALACYDEVLRRCPDNVESHYSRAMLRLKLGDFVGGWEEYAWRWRRAGQQLPKLPQPLWDGSPMLGGTLLLLAEQGLGDTVQFVRYAPLAAERSGARVCLCCQPELVSLLAGCPGVARVESISEGLPAFDAFVPLMNLPHLLGTTLETIPAQVPYIFVDPRLGNAWTARFADVKELKVGIVWQGRPAHARDRTRSVALRQFEVLGRIPGVRLYSLQKGSGVEQLTGVSASFAVTDLGAHIQDMADTAAAIRQLDLVICVDTAVAHLAGALGIPVWLVLPFASEWRWLVDRADSPWYPSMRLFRQRTAGDWDDVFERVAAALARET